MARLPPAPVARNHAPLRQRFALALLRMLGWRGILEPPPAARGIIIVYPHTSNWDFVVAMLYKIAVDLPVRWMGKDTLFRWPFRRLLLSLGGVPIRRDRRSGFVSALLEEFAGSDWMWLAIAPEGTRSHTDHWKSGFYRIAVAGNLPLGLGFIDYATRTVGIDKYLTLTGDEQRDFAEIRAFYADKHGRRRGREGRIGLRT